MYASEKCYICSYRWLGLIGQFRPKKLISAIRTELQSSDELELSVFRDAAKHFLDKSLYSIALATQLSLSPSSSLLWSIEQQGEKKGYRNKFKLYHQACISISFIFIFFLENILHTFIFPFFIFITSSCYTFMRNNGAKMNSNKFQKFASLQTTIP